jgi:hypothetical protein
MPSSNARKAARVYAEIPVTSPLDVEQVMFQLSDKHHADVRQAVLLVWFDADEVPEGGFGFDYEEVRS